MWFSRRTITKSISFSSFIFIVSLVVCSGIFFDTVLLKAVVSPIVNEVMISESAGGTGVDGVNLIEDSTKNIYIYGTFTDEDGCSDVKDTGNIRAAFYRSSVDGTYDCVPNNVNCYQAAYHSECSITNCDLGTETTANYQCIIPVQYYAQPTDTGIYQDSNWVAYVAVNDADNTSGALTSSTEVNSLAALQLSGSLEYGTLSFLATSTPKELIIKNTGNTVIDATVQGTDLMCSRGGIPAEYQHFTLVSGTEYISMSVLSSTMASVLDLNLFPFNFTESTTSLYFQLVMPPSGAAGSCSGNNSLTATIN